MPSATDFGVDSVVEVVEQIYGLEGREIGDEYVILCPDPDHNDTSPSCSVNTATGYYHCLSCGIGGDLAALGAVVLNQPREAVEALLRPDTPEGMLLALQRRVARLVAPVKRSRPLEVPDHQDRGDFSELLARQFTEESLEKWGIRYVKEQEFIGSRGEPYSIRESIAIPVRTSRGDLAGWCYRRTVASPGWQPRYLYTSGMAVSELWFGVPQPHVSQTAIVEGALDAIWLDQCGVPALALLGSKMGDRKIKWLKKYDSVILIPDRDVAGVRWCQRVADDIGTSVPVRIGQYREWMISKSDPTKRASDPEELTPTDVEIVVATAVPYLVWRHDILDKIHST